MESSQDVLTSIVGRKYEEVAEAKSRTSLAEITERIAMCEPPRGFLQRLRELIARDQLAVIAECKKASPSKGLIRADYRPAEIAISYESGGAACLSVLTDQDFFKGSSEHLTIARQSCQLPVLRKDFIVDPWQIRQSRALGADCILLIVAITEFSQLQEYVAIALELGMDVLVEVHCLAELDKALQVPNTIIGINNRNLRTFETNLATSIDLMRQIPSDRLVVAESGIHNTEDVDKLRLAGIRAFLVGESFMRASEPGTELRKIFQLDRDFAELTATA